MAPRPTFPTPGWWTAFGDPRLDELVTEALANNPNLAMMAARIQEAQALVMMTNAARLPQVSFNGSYLWQQYGKNQFVFPLSSRTFHSFQLPINVNYEVDLWGRISRQVKSAKEQVAASALDLESARIQLASMTAASYIQLLKYDVMLAHQTAQIDLLQQTAQKQHALFLQGLASSDVPAESQRLLAGAIATQAVLKRAQETTINQLAVLTGRPPHTLAKDFPRGSLERLKRPVEVTVGVPSELVTHRPDVQAQEALMRAASLDIDVARREFLPRVQLGASTGLSAVGIRNLFKWTSLSSFLYPQISQPLFTGGLLKGNLEATRARYEQLLHQYMNVLLTAFQEVEDSMASLRASEEGLVQVQAQQQAVALQVNQARRRHEVGVASALAWLPLAIAQEENAMRVAEQAAQTLIDRVSLAKALGGGYTAQP